MSLTVLANLFVPGVWEKAFMEAWVAKSRLIRSGIATPDPEIAKLLTSGGKTVNLPFFKNLTGEATPIEEGVSLVPDNIVTGTDVAQILIRGQAWGATDIAAWLSGEDPLQAIIDQLVDWVIGQDQTTLLAELKGVFADNVLNDAGDLTHNVAIEDGDNALAVNLISADAIIEASYKLGDSADMLSAMIVHSTVKKQMEKNDLIEFVPDSEGVDIARYRGMEVIVDDTMPRVNGLTSGFIYTTYIFAMGAVALESLLPADAIEVDRDALSSSTNLISRIRQIIHVRGIAWNAAAVLGAETPTNAELRLAANHNRVYERKNIRIVQLQTNG